MIVSLSEAIANLSNLVDRACNGERIIIAKNNLPIVDLVPHHREQKRKLGRLAGRCDMPDNFFAEDQEINEMFYGDD